MNVYINKSSKDSKLLVLVAANSKKEAWEHIIQRKDGEYYFELYDAEAFKLIGNVSANTDIPKIVYETTLISNNFSF